MQRRFFSAAPITGNECVLSGDEAHHLTRVLRADLGDQVVLFDNSGSEFVARIERINKHDVSLIIEGQEWADRELPLALQIAVALPKGERQKWLIEKAVELGVTSLMPLRAVHGVAQPTLEATERLRRQVIEASKQCARNRLMAIHSSIATDELFQCPENGALRLMTQPHAGVPMQRVLAAAHAAAIPAGIIVAIGPEGGWSETELSAAEKSGWTLVNLGKRILRVETAVCAVAALAGSWMEED